MIQVNAPSDSEDEAQALTTSQVCPHESSHTAYTGEGTSSAVTVQHSPTPEAVASRKRKSDPGAQ